MIITREQLRRLILEVVPSYNPFEDKGKPKAELSQMEKEYGPRLVSKHADEIKKLESKFLESNVVKTLTQIKSDKTDKVLNILRYAFVLQSLGDERKAQKNIERLSRRC